MHAALITMKIFRSIMPDALLNMKLIGIVYDTFCKAVMKEFGTGNFYIKYFVFSGVIL